MIRTRRIGVSEGFGAGEAREKARRGRKAVIFAGLFAVGLATGFFVGFTEAEDLLAGSGSDGWPPALAIGLACSYLAAVIGGGIALSRQTDEVERLAQYKAAAFAGLVYILAYPVWFALWMGDLVREPMHAVLFALFWLGLAGASIFYRFR